jgi:hypothetical protein|tara:strand:+ start:304 stop:489 length:186 start_codon:yes stop_codon:yes gene_type:complete
MDSTLKILDGGVGFLDEMIIELDETFPAYTPNPDDTLALIMFRAGQRSVVEHLQNKKDVSA